MNILQSVDSRKDSPHVNCKKKIYKQGILTHCRQSVLYGVLVYTVCIMVESPFPFKMLYFVRFR